MGSADKHAFLDDDGSPFATRIQGVLRVLRLRFGSRLQRIVDDVFVTEVFEEAGRKIVAHETEHGRVEDLEAFAWTVILNVARSRLGRSSMRVIGATHDHEASDAVLRALHARDGSREQIETDILVQQILARMTSEERDLYWRKAWGHSVRDIARACGKSEGHVNTLVYRMRLRIKELLQPTKGNGSGSTTQQPPKRRTM